MKLALFAAVAALALAGCGGGTHVASPAPMPMPSGTEVATPGPAGVQTVTVYGNDALMFEPMSLRAKTGALRVVFVNQGTIAHTFRIKGLEPDTGNVNGGVTDTITVTLPHPGTYYIECDYHPTMVGVLDVT